MDTFIFLKLVCLFFETREGILERSQLQKCPEFDLGEDGFRTSEIKQTEEWRQHRCCFLWQEDYNKHRSKSRKSFIGSSTSENVFVARKLSPVQERRQDHSCLFRRGDCRNKCHKQVNRPGLTVGESVGLGVIIFTCDI
jgi:hypothetical protein